jgi:hypothetical protein
MWSQQWPAWGPKALVVGLSIGILMGAGVLERNLERGVSALCAVDQSHALALPHSPVRDFLVPALRCDQ